MANLAQTSINGRLNLDTTNGLAMSSNSDMTDWYKITHYDGTVGGSKVHVRTPIPADTSAIGWNPIILEVHGFNDRNAINVHDFKALVNVNGYNNDWYGSQIKSNAGYNSTPTVYRSTNSYGGKQRVCFSVDNILTIQNEGYLWVRWWNNNSVWNSYPWGVTWSSDATGTF